MRKKTLYLFLVFLILFSIIINTGCTYLWGYHTIVSTDEIRHYDRAIQIALHRVDINKMWFQPKVYDLYPAGLHLLLSSFMMMSGDFNVFDISFIFKIMFALVSTLLAFLIGLKFNSTVAIFSAFFYITSFMIFTNSKTYYVYLFTYSNYITTTSITIIMLFVSTLSFFLSLKINKSKRVALSSIYVLSSVVHGISHISTFIGQLLNFSAFFIFLIVYEYVKNNKKIKDTAGLFLFLTMLSGFFTFLIYYYPMYSTIIGPEYKIYHLFPSLLPPQLIEKLPILLLLLVGLSFAFYFVILKLPSKAIILRKRYYVPVIVFGYILLYGYALYAVTTTPQSYVYSSVLIFSPFLTFIPKPPLSIISIYSLIAGFSIYLVSVIGLWYVLKKFERAKLMGYAYLSFFLIWFIAGFVIKYYASRIIYLQYFLPFILGISAYYFLSEFKRNYKEPTNKYITFVKRTFILLIVLILVMVSVTSFVNKEPAIREIENIENPLRFGTSQPPWWTYDSIVYTQHITNSSEYILGNSYSVQVLTATTGTLPPTSSWVTYYKNHTLWGVTVTAIRSPSRSNLIEFCKTYHPTRYMVVGYKEHFYYGPKMPVDYDNSPYLLKVYQSNGGQRMYLITF